MSEYKHGDKGVPRPDIRSRQIEIPLDQTTARLDAAKFIARQMFMLRTYSDGVDLSPKEEAVYAASLDFLEKFIDGA